MAVEFFGVPEDWYCYDTRYINGILEVWAQPTPNGHSVKIGTAEFGEEDAANFDFPLNVWLPEEQQVYRPNSGRDGRVLYGPMIRHSNFKGLYTSESGTIIRPISASLSSNITWNKLGGIMNGTQYIHIQANF